MKEIPPKVTILMPAYNAEKYIAEAIHSVLLQSFKDFRLVIINDGSTDQTQNIICSFVDERIQLINQTHSGIASALNRGLSQASSAYIARFDADDICFPDRLQKQVDFLEKHPYYIVVGSDAEYISENAEHLFHFKCIGHSHEQISEKIYTTCPFIHSSVMYRKQNIDDAGGYSIHAHNFEDHFLWIQLIKSGKFYNLPMQLIKIRFNPASVTIDERWRGRHFRKLKRDIIRKGMISEKEGVYLLNIIKKQDVNHIKESSYYALCGKKFLLENPSPEKARLHFSKAIGSYPFRFDNYAFYTLSFFPQPVIQWLYQLKSK
ncbi:MAG: glycosyltransferase [Ginsengibacter sp.]